MAQFTSLHTCNNTGRPSVFVVTAVVDPEAVVRALRDVCLVSLAPHVVQGDGSAALTVARLAGGGRGPVESHLTARHLHTKGKAGNLVHDGPCLKKLLAPSVNFEVLDNFSFISTLWTVKPKVEDISFGLNTLDRSMAARGQTQSQIHKLLKKF